MSVHVKQILYNEGKSEMCLRMDDTMDGKTRQNIYIRSWCECDVDGCFVGDRGCAFEVPFAHIQKWNGFAMFVYIQYV